jgi:hypothetical protein
MTQTYTIYANVDMFKKAGIAVPTGTGTFTWDDYRALAKKFTVDGKYGVAWGLKSPAAMTMIMGMNYNLTERRVAEILQPRMTGLVDVLRQRISSLEKEVDLLFQQCTLNVTRLVMADDGVCDWKALRSVLQSKLDRRLGVEAAALAANAVIVPAPPP